MEAEKSPRPRFEDGRCQSGKKESSLQHHAPRWRAFPPTEPVADGARRIGMYHAPCDDGAACPGFAAPAPPGRRRPGDVLSEEVPPSGQLVAWERSGSVRVVSASPDHRYCHRYLLRVPMSVQEVIPRHDPDQLPLCSTSVRGSPREHRRQPNRWKRRVHEGKGHPSLRTGRSHAGLGSARVHQCFR